MSELPEVGELVVVREMDGQSYASRVEDGDTDRLTVALPIDLIAARDYELGTEFDLAWTKPSGVHVVPVELIGNRAEHLVRLWDLVITGEGWVEQRREYVRVPVSGPVDITVDPLPAEVPPALTAQPLQGHLIDLSEAAIQCSLRFQPDDIRPVVGSPVTCSFGLHDDDFCVPGFVHSIRSGTARLDARLVVRFDQSEYGTDLLRKHVFDFQLEMRRDRRR